MFHLFMYYYLETIGSSQTPVIFPSSQRGIPTINMSLCFSLSLSDIICYTLFSFPRNVNNNSFRHNNICACYLYFNCRHIGCHLCVDCET